MKGDRKYYIIIVSVFLILFLVQITQKEPTNYNHSFSHRDKNPYGGYVLKDLLPGFLRQNEIQSLNLTLYEIEEDLDGDQNLMIIADRVGLQKEDTDVLLNKVTEGMTAFISAQYIGGILADTLGFHMLENEFEYLLNANQDTSEVKLIRDMGSNQLFRFKKDAISTYFSKSDSVEYRVLATNGDNKPVAIKIAWGMGEIYLNTTPLAFTNNYLFFENNAEYAAALLSVLPERPTTWTEYYQLGRLEIRTPLRVILTSPPLKFAYTITLISLLLFMFFEAKRKQRIIPIITPLRNTTLDFVKTIGNLYRKSGNHKDIASKRIQYFLEYIRTKYYLNFDSFSPDFFERLSSKSGQDLVTIKKLFDLINKIKNQPQVSEQELKNLSAQIEIFYGRK